MRTRSPIRQSSSAIFLFSQLLLATKLPTCRCFTAEKTVVILYNKPPNVITSHSSADLAPKSSGDSGRMTVYEDVMSTKGYVSRDEGGRQGQQSFKEITGIHAGTKLHAVGRLDADTSGLLLLTNDGALIHRVTNPTAAAAASTDDDFASNNNDEPYKKLVTKTYVAVIMGHHEQDSPGLQKILNEGVDLGAKYGTTKPAIDLKVVSHPTAKSTVVEITIAEGKNRQVRRTFHAIGSGVMKLKRTHIGSGLNLGRLKQGQWRVLGADEVESSLGWKVRTLNPIPGRRKPFRSQSDNTRGSGRGRTIKLRSSAR